MVVDENKMTFVENGVFSKRRGFAEGLSTYFSIALASLYNNLFLLFSKQSGTHCWNVQEVSNLHIILHAIPPAQCTVLFTALPNFPLKNWKWLPANDFESQNIRLCDLDKFFAWPRHDEWIATHHDGWYVISGDGWVLGVSLCAHDWLTSRGKTRNAEIFCSSFMIR